MNSITSIKYTSKEISTILEISTKQLHNIAEAENLGFRNKGKFYFTNSDFTIEEQNEINNIPFKKFYWNENALKFFKIYINNHFV